MTHSVPRDGDRVTATGAVELLPARPPRLDFRPGSIQRRPRPSGTPCPAGIDVPCLPSMRQAGEWVTVIGTLRGVQLDPHVRVVEP